MVRFLFLGEIVGKTGLVAIKNGLPAIRKKYNIDYTVANGEGTTGGFGLGKVHSITLSKYGIDLITGGEKLFYKIDMVDFISKSSFILRPLNYPTQAPGRSFKKLQLNGAKFVIVNLQGNSEMKQNLANAFSSIDYFLRHNEDDSIVLLQFHASTTAEKNTMLHFLDGRVAAVIGTHTKVMSADSILTRKNTAYISDNGRCGSFMSVGGFESGNEIDKFKFARSIRSEDSPDVPVINGVVVEIDEKAGKAVGIIPVFEKLENLGDEE